jgi:glucose/arabinose dehydrogenase
MTRPVETHLGEEHSMRRAVAIAALAVSISALPPLGGQPAAAAVSKVLVVDCRAGNPTCWPAAFAFTPNGSNIFYVERFTGQIRRHGVNTGADRLWATIGNVGTAGEQGVLGIALDPRWDQAARSRWVYVYYTNADPLENRIIRLKNLSGGGLRRETLVQIPAATVHNGGVIHFGPDGKLYAVTGDATNLSRAQDVSNLAGKVLRLNLNGSRPADNPIADSKAFSYGHRNSFGFTFDPQTDVLWQTENGPECEDEINLVLPGANYGWGPGSDCPGISTSGPNPVQPEWNSGSATIAPTGAAFCDGCGLGTEPEGNLLVGIWNQGSIRRWVLDAERDDLVGDFLLYQSSASVAAVEAAPNGGIHFSDNSGIYRLQLT